MILETEDGVLEPALYHMNSFTDIYNKQCSAASVSSRTSSQR
jgi:hypothetical protein